MKTNTLYSKYLSKSLLIILACIISGVAAGIFAAAFKTPLIPLAIVGAAAVALFVIQSAQISLYALIAVAYLLPFAAVPVRIGFYPTFLDGTLIALFGVWVMKIMVRPAPSIDHEDEPTIITTPLDFPIIVFLVLAFFSFVAGLAHAHLSPNLLRHFAEIILCVALYLVITNNVRTKAQLESVTRIIIIAGFISALIGVVLYFIPQHLTEQLLAKLGVIHYYINGEPILRYIEDDPSLPLRATSTAVDPNVLGGMLILVTALTAAQFFAEKPLFSRKITSVMLGTMGLCLLLTFSRGSLAGLAGALIVLAVLRYRKLMWILLIAAVLMLMLPQTQYYVQRFVEGLRGEDRATQMRFGEYKDALILISRYPVFGVGFGGSPDIDTYIGVSNVYLLIAEEMGLLGLSAFLWIMFLFFTTGWREANAARRDDTLEPILWGALAAVLGALGGGVFDHYFFNLNFPHSVALFWLHIGIGMTAVRLGSENRA